MGTVKTYQQFSELMQKDIAIFNKSADNVLEGLNVIASYLPERSVLIKASHEEIQSVSCTLLIEANITEEDVMKLRNLNWMLEGEYLACFV